MKVLLTTLSAKALHKTLAPWCLKAYCDAHVPDCQITVQEHTVNDHIGDIVTKLYQSAPDVLGFSCYIWNIEQTVKVARMLKKYLPYCLIVLGGPEVSFETETGAYPFADYIIQGAGETAFAGLLQAIKSGKPPGDRMISSQSPPRLDELPSPYTEAYYKSFEESPMMTIANQLVYFESARGCPFSCTYCLSSTCEGVDELTLDRVYSQLDSLVARGAKCIKFVDRTFNANRCRAGEILQYILSLETDCTFHFEVAADLFDAELLELTSQMPPGRVQFEIGIQSTNPETLKEIARVTDTDHALRNIRTLIGFGNCHIHVDLIAGLPFETMETVARGIDACIQARPHMLQLGFLKLLKGTKIRENSAAYGYVYNDFAPYEVFRSGSMCFADMIKLRGIEAVIDKFYNSGVFKHSIDYALAHVFERPYQLFESLADFCKDENPKISQKHAYTMLFRFLCRHTDPEAAAHVIKLDCLTYHTKAVLPDEIPTQRDKAAEQEVKRSKQPFYKSVRVECFPYDKKTRAFICDEKCERSGAYKVIELP